MSERHAGGTGGLAGPTSEAKVEMTSHRRRQVDPSLGGRSHEIDASARGVHLLSEDAIGRALRETDSAVHAGAQTIHRWGIPERERPDARLVVHSPPTKRPGFRMPSGSNCIFTLVMIASESALMGPQTSDWPLSI